MTSATDHRYVAGPVEPAHLISNGEPVGGRPPGPKVRSDRHAATDSYATVKTVNDQKW